jgi:hypothetical protein
VEYWIADMAEQWALIENFETGSSRKFGLDDAVKSDLFENFHFGVREMLIDTLE